MKMVITLSSTLFTALLCTAGIFLLTTVFLIMMLISIPECVIFIKAKLKKRPIVQIHTALKQTELLSPKLEGKKNKTTNRFDIPRFGTKFVPEPGMVEHIGSNRIINYYSKAPIALDAKAVAAFRDIERYLKEIGITPTEPILDILIGMSDDEITEMTEYNVKSDDNQIITLSADDIVKIRDDLKNMIIRDGQFVWETARNFIFLMQTETSRSLDESIAIAREQALSDAALGLDQKQNMMNVIYIVTLLMGGVLAYKMLVG